MLYKVYHYDMEKYRCFLGRWDGASPSFEDYKLVATVNAESIEDVFRLTNHIDNDWRENAYVTPTKEAQRSTSVGDIVEDEKRKRWICQSMGWKEL